MANEPPETSNFETKLNAAAEMIATNEDPRFAADKMVVCEKCSRSSPPNRERCIYCGSALAADKIDLGLAKIDLQRPEQWEDGFSLVYAGEGGLDDSVIAAAAEMLDVDRDALVRALNVGAAVPIVYLRSLPDAGLLGSRLSEIGFHCAVVGDDLLQANVPPTRVRSLKFNDALMRVEAFNTGATTDIGCQEKVLVVIGALVKRSTAVAGRVKKGALKGADETLAYEDEQVVDIYPESDVYGFRIRPSGFDFSCLGGEMQPLASANMAELLSKIRSSFPNAKFIDEFRSASPLIVDIWPSDEFRRSSEVKRGTFGGVRKESLTVVDNSRQFTRFSRLQRHFL
jgi:hypothetical protein